MKRLLSVALPVALVALLVGAAFAQMGGGPMAGGMSGGMGMMGSGAGQAGCPGMSATGTTEPISEEKARALAQQYAEKYLKGFTVEKVLPFAMPHGTAYSVELRGPKDEVRIFHINPWGNVMPFGGPARRAG